MTSPSDATGSAEARWEGMIESAKLILANPLGVGLGQDILGLRDRGLLTWHHVHSVYLQIGVDLGVVGLGIFGVLCWKLVRGLRRSLRALETVPGTEALRALGRGVEIALLAFLVQAMVYPVALQLLLLLPRSVLGSCPGHGPEAAIEREGFPGRVAIARSA